MSAEFDNFSAIFEGYGAPLQVLEDCVREKLPYLVNDPNELICRTWECYLDERSRLLRGEPFVLLETLYRIADRLGGRNYDYALPELHCSLGGVAWKWNRCGFAFPVVIGGLKWNALAVLKLTTLCSIWAIAPEFYCYENWSRVLRYSYFSADVERLIEKIIIEKTHAGSANDPVLTITARALLDLLKKEPLSRKELENRLDVKRTTLRVHYIKPAEDLGLIETTCAQRFSKEQRYRLTARGREVLAHVNR